MKRGDFPLDSDAVSRKRPVNLTLNEALVSQARGMTNNLSALVEELLGEHVESELRQRLARAAVVEQTIFIWNRFEADKGSFADEHTTL